MFRGHLLCVGPGRRPVGKDRHSPHVADPPSTRVRQAFAIGRKRRGTNAEALGDGERIPDGLSVVSHRLLP
jgi:hypothetical protein